MIDYPMAPVVKAGKVITLCASVSVSGSVSAEAMVRRGQIVTALALALARMGYALEVYVDLHGQSSATANRSVTRTLVKTAERHYRPLRGSCSRWHTLRCCESSTSPRWRTSLAVWR
jgi:hypothetical protein